MGSQKPAENYGELVGSNRPPLKTKQDRSNSFGGRKKNSVDMQLDWVKKAGKKATPLFVHFLMIVSVGAYAIFGALVMRKLESKTITTVEKKVDFQGEESLSNPTMLPQFLEQRHKRRRRHNELPDISAPRGKRAAAHIMRSRKCVINIIKKMSSFECSLDRLDETLVKQLDECYHVAIEHNTHVNHVLYSNSREQIESVGEESEEVTEWSFMDSLLFAFTVITTIGYGNVAPRTFGGRLFVIGYGLVGIPFTLLAIADLGKFISEMMTVARNFFKKTWKKLKRAWAPHSSSFFMRYPKLSNAKSMMNQDIEEKILEEEKADSETESSEEEDELSETEALSLFILFLVYIAFGGIMLATYEPDMDFFKAVYFNFVTLTSIGLGDIVPRSESYMLITIVYIAIGLALTTIAIEIAADALKKLHYFGRKIENVGNVAIWFGGKKITMKALVKNLGDQFNLPTTVIKNLNLDHFVDQAIRVEEGEIETLRPPPFEPSSDKFDAEFADEPESEWIRDPTPTPPPSPKPVYQLPVLKPDSISSVSSEPSLESLAIVTPSPETSDDEEVILPSPEPSPIREPTPRVPTPREPTPEPEPEPMKEPTPPPPPPPKPRPLTAAEIAAQKRKAYSEEAWRRYQEYQKQWKKFRQTQKTPGAGTSSSGASTSKVPKSKGTSPEGTGSSTRSQSVASIASGRTSRSATPESKKSSHQSGSSRGEGSGK